MRAATFLVLALVAKLASGAALAIPFVPKKERAASPPPAGIVMKRSIVQSIDDERVELDVRQPVEPIEPASTTSSPKPIVRTAAPLSEAAPAARALPPFTALASARVDELPMCRRGDAAGPGVAEVTFLPEGGAKVKLSAPYADTATGACVARRLGRDATSFVGEPIVVHVRFSL